MKKDDSELIWDSFLAEGRDDHGYNQGLDDAGNEAAHWVEYRDKLKQSNPDLARQRAQSKQEMGLRLTDADKAALGGQPEGTGPVTDLGSTEPDHEESYDDLVGGDTPEQKKSWELKITWPNRAGTTYSISDMHWNSVEAPTEDDIRAWVKQGWDEHGQIMNDEAKRSIPDPMKFNLQVMGTYGDDEDRGSVGFKKGGRPLHGG